MCAHHGGHSGMMTVCIGSGRVRTLSGRGSRRRDGVNALLAYFHCFSTSVRKDVVRAALSSCLNE
jgi:hypothetical protein